MKAEIYYFTKKAFRENPTKFFMDAENTIQMLSESGLTNFVKVDAYEENTNLSKEQFAERIFAIYNDGAEFGNPLGTLEGQQKLRAIGAGHTSMSINDFIVIDNEVWIVDSNGFKNIGKHPAITEVGF